MTSPGHKNYLCRVSLHCAGVIFYEMLYGRRPFYAGVDQETIANSHLLLQHNALTFDAKPNVSQGAKDFIKRLLTYNHQLRPDVHEAAKDKYLHPFLKQRRPASTAASLRPPGVQACAVRLFEKSVCVMHTCVEMCHTKVPELRFTHVPDGS